MDGMIFSGHNQSAAPAGLIEEKSLDLVMTPVPGDLDQAVTVPFRICGACLEQDTHYVRMPFPHCEVDSRSVEIFSTAQARIAFDQALKCERVACRGGRDRVPDIVAAIRFQLRRSDHASVYVGFEPWPAMESVRPGEHKLSIVQGELLWISAWISRRGFCHGVWLAGTHCVQ
jgi:hypothetical protein